MQNHFLFPLLSLGLLGFFCPVTSAQTTPQDIYRYHGLKPAQGPGSQDSIFQDFAIKTDNLAKIWADPDAEAHDGLQKS